MSFASLLLTLVILPIDTGEAWARLPNVIRPVPLMLPTVPLVHPEVSLMLAQRRVDVIDSDRPDPLIVGGDLARR